MNLPKLHLKLDERGQPCCGRCGKPIGRIGHVYSREDDEYGTGTNIAESRYESRSQPGSRLLLPPGWHSSPIEGSPFVRWECGRQRRPYRTSYGHVGWQPHQAISLPAVIVCPTECAAVQLAAAEELGIDRGQATIPVRSLQPPRRVGVESPLVRKGLGINWGDDWVEEHGLPDEE